ncbi:MAG: aminotransferase DegT [Flavobacteriaceae bacterium]|nr:aminotransferase DegT [Flavobacteriaceae bacterium]|tara:strand:- start:303 stop:1442 length:1140 start_codon:yes stop_codon:yes gene_type:complete
MYSEVVSFIQKTFGTTDFLPLHEPRFVGNEKKYVADAIDSTFVSSVGAYVNRFEEDFSVATQQKYTVATVNGTAALHIAMLLVAVEKDTEVLTQALTFVATCNAISYIGAIPHFVDVSKDTLGMCPEKLEEYLADIAEIRNEGCYNKHTGRRISACVPMHTFGHIGDIERIVSICDAYQIPVVEDAAEALGSYKNGKHAGSFGKVAAFSFNGNKIITSGGGGAITTANETLAKKAKHLTTTAKIPHKYKYEHDSIGYNYRMPNLNAALLVAQLEQLPLFLEKKRALAQQYRDFFKAQSLTFITEPKNATSNYWLMALLLENESERDAFLEYTNEHNVMTRPIWQLMNRLSMFSDCPSAPLPNSEFLEARVVNIPSSVIL